MEYRHKIGQQWETLQLRDIKMKYEHALEIAQSVRDQLAPFCHRCEIAGSIRRKKAECGDVEIVCIPKNPVGYVAVINKWKKVKGDAIAKYTQRIHTSGIKLDIFTATQKNWGLIYAIRTGSADFSHRVLAVGWVKAGYESKDGMLTKKRTGEIVNVQEEADLFRMIFHPFVKPEDRN
jgi:DNA polymerase/3'-5' exonuclease PolX